MKKYLKYLGGAIVTIALLSSLVISSLAVRPEDTYETFFVDASPNMYDNISLTFTQYLDTSDEGATDPNEMLSASKTFHIQDCIVEPDGLGNYRLRLNPYQNSNWWYDDALGSYNTQGRAELSVYIPFVDENGTKFEDLQSISYYELRYLQLVFNMYMFNNYGNITNRAASFYIDTVDSGYIPIRQDSYDNQSGADYTIISSAKLKTDNIKGFVFRFRFEGLPRYDSTFVFTIDAHPNASYLEVFDSKSYYDSVSDELLQESEDFLKDLQNNDIQLDLPSIDDLRDNFESFQEAIESYGLLPFIDLDDYDTPFVRIAYDLIVLNLSFAIIGVIIWGGKK